MITQEWQEGHAYGATGNNKWHGPYESPYVDLIGTADQQKHHDWMAGWGCGNAEALIAPHAIPTAPV